MLRKDLSLKVKSETDNDEYKRTNREEVLNRFQITVSPRKVIEKLRSSSKTNKMYQLVPELKKLVLLMVGEYSSNIPATIATH